MSSRVVSWTNDTSKFREVCKFLNLDYIMDINDRNQWGDEMEEKLLSYITHFIHYYLAIFDLDILLFNIYKFSFFRYNFSYFLDCYLEITSKL